MESSNRISHIAVAIKPENFERAVQDFSFVFSTAFFGPLVREDQGLRVAVSWDAGLELQSPLDPQDDSPLSVLLRERGEGLLGFVYRVRDLDASVARLDQAGYQSFARVSGLTGVEPWSDRFRLIDEAFFGGFYGCMFALGQIEEA
jgi:hypothetical protein